MLHHSTLTKFLLLSLCSSKDRAGSSVWREPETLLVEGFPLPTPGSGVTLEGRVICRKAGAGRVGRSVWAFPRDGADVFPHPLCTCKIFLVLGTERKALQLGDAKGRRWTECSGDGLCHVGLDHKAVGTNGKS